MLQDCLEEFILLLCNFRVISNALRTWLSKLDEPRERSESLSTHYRKIGNDYHSNHADMDRLAADYFTKAIYCAPRNSIELAYAHANRAASLCRNSNFADVSARDAVNRPESLN